MQYNRPSAFHVTLCQTIDPAQFAAYNSVECVIMFNFMFFCPHFTWCSVGAVFKLTVHAEPDLGLGKRTSRHVRDGTNVLLNQSVFVASYHLSGLNLVRSDLWEKSSGTPSLSVHAGAQL